MQALSQLSYGPTEGREFWASPPRKSNREFYMTATMITRDPARRI